MKNLISMTDFVLEQEREFDRARAGFNEFTNNVCNYAKFLKQPLELWMFVPCKLVDGVWVVLAHPNFIKGKRNALFFNNKMDEYQQAKERCLFEGFEFNFKTSHIICFSNKVHNIRFYKNGWLTIDAKDIETIEDLIKYNLQLTQTAQKQIGL